MSIKLIDAAKNFKDLKHQIDAWEWLQKNISPEVLEEFAIQYRQNTKKPLINTWDEIVKIAKKAGAKFPEVVAAQWALESGYGKFTSGTNNFFGLKGKGSTSGTKEFINNKWIEIKDDFMDFPDLESCVQYLVDHWYKDYNVYKGVNRADNRNECAQLLVTEQYATDPEYTKKLINIMNEKLGPLPIVSNEKVLTVPYFYQLDNQSGKGFRECFSSSCAMIAAFYGKVTSDDEYNKIRTNFGDTTDSMAQLKTLRHMGLNAKFISNGNTKLIENEINNNRPIAVGWLHQGPIS
jgi:hypothetical protein